MTVGLGVVGVVTVGGVGALGTVGVLTVGGVVVGAAWGALAVGLGVVGVVTVGGVGPPGATGALTVGGVGAGGIGAFTVGDDALGVAVSSKGFCSAAIFSRSAAPQGKALLFWRRSSSAMTSAIEHDCSVQDFAVSKAFLQ